MLDDVELRHCCFELAQWALTKPEIAELWIYGSRARGDHHAESDLDIAVILSGGSVGERLADWICSKANWEKELSTLLPIAVDLDVGDRDISSDIVAPALKREGKLVFSRQKDL